MEIEFEWDQNKERIFVKRCTRQKTAAQRQVFLRVIRDVLDRYIPLVHIRTYENNIKH